MDVNRAAELESLLQKKLKSAGQTKVWKVVNKMQDRSVRSRWFEDNRDEILHNSTLYV